MLANVLLGKATDLFFSGAAVAEDSVRVEGWIEKKRSRPGNSEGELPTATFQDR